MRLCYTKVCEVFQMATKRSYSAKAARKGKDIGKPGKNFSKIDSNPLKRQFADDFAVAWSILEVAKVDAVAPPSFSTPRGHLAELIEFGCKANATLVRNHVGLRGRPCRAPTQRQNTY